MHKMYASILFAQYAYLKQCTLDSEVLEIENIDNVFVIVTGLPQISSTVIST